MSIRHVSHGVDSLFDERVKSYETLSRQELGRLADKMLGDSTASWDTFREEGSGRSRNRRLCPNCSSLFDTRGICQGCGGDASGSDVS